MIGYPHRDVLAWAAPWPIAFRHARRWRIRFLTLKQTLRFKTFWTDARGRRVSAKVAAARIRKNWLGKDHQVASAARVGLCLHRPVVMVLDGVLVDGNHTLLALERRRYKGRVLVLEA